ncbi:hypothetical protein GF312_13310 [Candidatus Poribacteria bacterium]|nr:hypothetical protein [Candidatus Poribacteria bacterium]
MFNAIGIWVAIGLTICVYSFLYKDNPLFKFAEHLFVGISAGYLLAIAYHTNFLPYIYYPLKSALTEGKYREFSVLIPSLMGLMLFSRFVPRYNWMVRWPFAFLMGYSAGVKIPVIMQADIYRQIQGTIQPFGDKSSLWAITNAVMIMLGVICTLIYFFFSRERKGLSGGLSEAGIIFLMIGFGASFGYTVMARISLLIGRVDFLLQNIPFINSIVSNGR